MVETSSNEIKEPAGTDASTPWLIPLPLPPPIEEVERCFEVKKKTEKDASETPGIDLHPGAPQYLWEVAKTRRPDGRDSALQLRPMKAETSLFSAADGSCKLMQGNTCVVASVTGPVASSLRRNTNLSEAFCEVFVRPRTGNSQQSDKRLEFELQNIVQHTVNVQLYPRTTLQVVVQVACEDSPLLSTCVNALCLALLDAGVNLRCTFAATCIATRPSRAQNGQEMTGFLLDPTTDELEFCSGALCLVYDVGTGGLIASSDEQELLLVSTDEMDRLIRLGYAAATRVKRFYRQKMQKSLKAIETTIEAQNWFSSDS